VVEKSNPESPYPVNVPGTVKSVTFIEKDSSETFKPVGKNASLARNLCHQCHIAVKAKDYIFTGYPPR